MTKRQTDQEPTEPVSPEQGATPELDVITAERDQFRDQFLRAMADLQNYRRRAQQELEDTRKRATEHLVRELIPVLDNFERTIQSVQSGASPEAVIEGIEAIDRQFRNVLSGVRLSRIEAVGADFDPEQHEALALEPTEEFEEGKVIEELQPGYKMADRVIRPARVKVAKRP